jgi:soluble lytic murein transglycosylase-like protein
MIPDPQLLAIVEKAALAEGIDVNLAKAIVAVESSWDPKVSRYEKNWGYLYFVREYAEKNNITVETETTLQSMSIGLMQIMGTVARELGFDGNLSDLFKPDVNVFYGCKKLKQLLRKYPSEIDVISSYNQGSPKKTDGGLHRNFQYVDKVSKVLRELRHE